LSLRQSVIAATGALTIIGIAPVITFGTNVTPITAIHQLQGSAPSLREFITIPTWSLSLAVFSPNLTGLALAAFPQSTSLVLTAYTVNAVAFHPRKGIAISSESDTIQISKEIRSISISREYHVR
jgi:hypothetical protein